MVKKKFVLVINNFMVGGVERLLRDILPRFSSDLVDITVITVWGSGPLATTYQSRGLRIYWAAGRIWYSSKNPLPKPYFTIVAPLTFVRLFLIMKRIRPDVVMTCLTQADIMGIAAAKLAGVPHRVIRQADVKPLLPIIYWFKQHLAINFATKIIANSHPTNLFVRDYFQVAADKVVTVPNGVDLVHFQQAFSISTERRSPTVVGFLGRFEEIKGPQCLLEAIRLLRDRHRLTPPTLLFGDGSLLPDLKDYAQRWQLEQVIFGGQVMDPMTALQAIDILVVPSVSEGFGLVVLEGLASGKIVIASDLPVISELITNGVNGITFPRGNVTALAQQLAAVLTDAEQRNQLRQQTNQWVAGDGRRYDINKVAARYQSELFG